MKINTPLRTHGGKHYLASKIVGLMPPHMHYVEPYFGGGSVLLAKDPNGVSEVANDIDGDITNFWQVLRDRNTFDELRWMSHFTPFSEAEWDRARSAMVERGGDTVEDDDVDRINRAWRFFVDCRMSLAGRMKAFTGVTKTRTRRGMNGEVSAWLSAMRGLPEVHDRLKRVLILNRDATDVIRGQDGPETLFYLDPPYLHETRTSTDVYAHEMTRGRHEELLRLILGCEGKVMISGYRSDLYDELLREWTREDWEIANHAAGGKKKRRMIESIWMNF